MISDKAKATAEKYKGDLAARYLSKRQGQEKWKAEDRVLRAMLEGEPIGTEILDCPVGTGRFLPFFRERGFAVLGIDASEDMLRQALTHYYSGCELQNGSIFDLQFPGNCVDVAVSIRIMNLIATKDLPLALGELQRVARRRVIFNLRIATKDNGDRYKNARPLELVHQALQPGWTLTQNREIHEPDFRMLELSCAG